MSAPAHDVDAGRRPILWGKTLAAQLRAFLAPRTVIVGVGSIARGDDGFGPAVVQCLTGRTTAALVDAGCCPENYLGQVVQHRPDSVLILDAAELGKTPGHLMWCDAQELAPAGLSSHAGSLAMSVQYIQCMTGAACRLLLVQPAKLTSTPPSACGPETCVEPLAGLSPQVQAAVRRVCRAIITAENVKSPRFISTTNVL